MIWNAIELDDDLSIFFSPLLKLKIEKRTSYDVSIENKNLNHLPFMRLSRLIPIRMELENGGADALN